MKEIALILCSLRQVPINHLYLLLYIAQQHCNNAGLNENHKRDLYNDSLTVLENISLSFGLIFLM